MLLIRAGAKKREDELEQDMGTLIRVITALLLSTYAAGPSPSAGTWMNDPNGLLSQNGGLTRELIIKIVGFPVLLVGLVAMVAYGLRRLIARFGRTRGNPVELPDIATPEDTGVSGEKPMEMHGMKKCPFCAEEIKNDAIKCKHCGEFLAGSRQMPSPSAQARSRQGSPALRVIGMLALIGGLYTLTYYWQFFDTGVEVPTQTILGQTVGGGRVHNIGLMQERQNGMLAGGVFATLGLICIVAGEYGGGRR
jgi:hypothetical protein